MKNFLSASSLLLMVACLITCQPRKSTENIASDPPLSHQMTYDSLKAKEYGADDFGMKKYVFAFLHRGPNHHQDSARAAELQRAHLQNIMKMAEAGKLVLAGPFLDDSDLRGIYIFNVETVAEAEALTNTDPSIQEGVLRMELKEWYGSAALMEVNELHQRLAKQNVAD